MNHAYVCRVLTTDAKPKRVWWFWDKGSIIKGEVGESFKAIRDRWETSHGKLDQVTRYRGVMRAGEAAMTVGHTRRLPPQKG